MPFAFRLNDFICRLLPFLVLLTPGWTRANDGVLDPSFGNLLAGRSRVAFPSVPGLQVAASAAVQADGKIVLAGLLNYGQSAQPQMAGVARLTADGELDTTFAQGGFLTVPAALALVDITVLPDGKIVLVGESSGANADFLVMRLTASGQADTTFNGTGFATIAFDLGGTNVDIAQVVIPLPGGDLMVAGNVERPASSSDVALVRLDASGHLVTSFGLQGRDVIDAFDAPGVATSFDNVSMHRFPAGGFIVNVALATNGNSHAAAFRLHDDGSVDNTYGQAGLATMSNIGSVRSALQPDGKLVIVGGSTSSPARFAIERLLASGNPDSSFGGVTGDLGTTYISFGLGGNADTAFAVAVLPDTRILVAGISATAPRCSANVGAVMNAVRLLPNGFIDTDFGSGAAHSAVVDMILGGDCQTIAFNAVLQAGRPVLIGSTSTDTQAGATSSSVMAVARLTVDRIFANGFD